MRKLIFAALLPALSCTTAADDPNGTSGPVVDIEIAALDLAGVVDAVWDIEVKNGASPAAIVWARRITSSRYGDGAGSASYVGPCDGDEDAKTNTVTVHLRGIYDSASAATLTTDLSSQSATDYGANNAAFACPEGPLCGADFRDPGDLVREFQCLEGRDTAVTFDVAVMRPANQGFFDVAVNFNQIYCSAKFDCCRVDGDPNGDDALCDRPTEDLELLYNGADRDTTFVLGFACTAGTAANVETQLMMRDIALDCDDDGVADVVVTPDGDGNLDASRVDDPDGYLFGAAVYRGEQFIGAVSSYYWNVALGVTPAAISAPCVLTTTATADDRNNTGDGVFVDGALRIEAGFVYPVVTWRVPFDTCTEHALDETTAVFTDYTDIDGGTETFAHGLSRLGYAPSLPTLYKLGTVTTYNEATLFTDRIHAILCDSDPMMGEMIDCRFLFDPATIYADVKYGYDTPNFNDVTGCYAGYPEAVGYNFKEVNSGGGNTAAFECHTKAIQALGQLFFTAEEKAELHAWAVANDLYTADSTGTILDISW